MFCSFGFGMLFLAVIWFVHSVVTQEARLVLANGMLSDGTPLRRFKPGAVLLNVFGHWLQIGYLRSHEINGTETIPAISNPESE